MQTDLSEPDSAFDSPKRVPSLPISPNRKGSLRQNDFDGNAVNQDLVR